jgi:hypothetical protein
MQEHIAVGVASQALCVLNGQPADDQGDVGFEFVRVVTKADANVHTIACLAKEYREVKHFLRG